MTDDGLRTLPTPCRWCGAIIAVPTRMPDDEALGVLREHEARCELREVDGRLEQDMVDGVMR